MLVAWITIPTNWSSITLTHKKGPKYVNLPVSILYTHSLSEVVAVKRFSVHICTPAEFGHWEKVVMTR